jgi:hypothetical protein
VDARIAAAQAADLRRITNSQALPQCNRDVLPGNLNISTMLATGRVILKVHGPTSINGW